MRPVLLDLFCCQGGAATGYHRAGFDIIGVDIEPQPRYPFPMVQADALEFLAFANLSPFAAIHASPPCQDYSVAFRGMVPPGKYPRLIDPLRDALRKTGIPWVIENVAGAPLPVQSDLFGAHGMELCGTMFGLSVWWHRLFEASLPIAAPRGCDHSARPMNPHRQSGRDRIYAEHGRGNPERVWRRAKGVEWMDQHGGREAIPPAYTEHIGRSLLAAIEAGEAA